MMQLIIISSGSDNSHCLLNLSASGINMCQCSCFPSVSSFWNAREQHRRLHTGLHKTFKSIHNVLQIVLQLIRQSKMFVNIFTIRTTPNQKHVSFYSVRCVIQWTFKNSITTSPKFPKLIKQVVIIFPFMKEQMAEGQACCNNDWTWGLEDFYEGLYDFPDCLYQNHHCHPYHVRTTITPTTACTSSSTKSQFYMELYQFFVTTICLYFA